jgi:multidrug efflux pump subunit AcrA (membrane-fusion protein)
MPDVHNLCLKAAGNTAHALENVRVLIYFVCGDSTQINIMPFIFKHSFLHLAIACLPIMLSGHHAHAQPYGTYTVKLEAAIGVIDVGGTVVAEQAATLTAQQPGRIKTITGKEGDAFKTGQVLIELDDAELQAKRRAAVAALNNANTQFRREIISPRAKSSPGGMGFPSMMDQIVTNPMQSIIGTRDTDAERHADIISRDTGVKEAQSNLRMIDAKLRDSRSLAPFDGVITRKHVEVGDTVQPGMPLVDFADINGLQVQVDVPARLRGLLKKGTHLPVKLDGATAPVKALLTRLFPTVNPRTHTVRIKLALPSGIDAAVGMYAAVSVPDGRNQTRKRIAVPARAIGQQGSITMVRTVAENGSHHLRLVRVGDVLLDGRVEILSGLNEGDIVLVQP